MATIIVCGSRWWTNGETIATVLSVVPKYTVVVNGYARGADYLASLICKSELGLRAIDVPADWDKYGKAAGMRRNRDMLVYRPKLVVGFHDQMWKSRGTRNMMKLCEYNQIPFYLVTQTWLERERLKSLLSPLRTSGLEGMVSLLMQLRSSRQSGQEL